MDVSFWKYFGKISSDLGSGNGIAKMEMERGKALHLLSYSCLAGRHYTIPGNAMQCNALQYLTA